MNKRCVELYVLSDTNQNYSFVFYSICYKYSINGGRKTNVLVGVNPTCTTLSIFY